MRPSPPPLAKLPRKHHAFLKAVADDINARYSASVTEPSCDVTEDGDAENTSRVKCVLVGDGAIGKTSLIVSYTTNGYPTEYEPTAFDNYAVVVTVDSQPVRLQLCDTAGQDDFDSLRPLCYPGTDVFLLCFSVVVPASYYNITDKWVPELRKHAPDAALVLIGTQCDLRDDVKELIDLARYHEKPVTEEQARHTMKHIGAIQYIECSALTQVNLKEVFDSAILAALEKHGVLRRIVGGKTKRHKKQLSGKKRWRRLCCLT